MKSRFYIVGIKHCGKSTVGRALSKALNLPYFDLDDLIEDSVKMSVREYYIKEGREAFFTQEKIALEHLNSSKEKFVCATGGGICDNSEAVKILRKLDTKIFINTAFETLYARIIKNGVPPFLKSDDPQNEFHLLYTKRTKLYKELNSIEINGNNKIPFEINKEILTLIKEL